MFLMINLMVQQDNVDTFLCVFPDIYFSWMMVKQCNIYVPYHFDHE